MDFAADAVLDVIAPPARPAPARTPAAASGDEPRFDDHLQAEIEDADSGAKAAAPRSEQPREQSALAKAPDPAGTLLGGEVPPAAAPAPPAVEQVASAVFVQLVAAAVPTQQSDAQQTASRSAPVGAPNTPAPTPGTPAPMQAAPTTQDAPAAAPQIAAPTAGSIPESQKSVGPAEKNMTPPTEQTPQILPAPTQPQAAPASATPAVAAPPSAPAEAAEIALAMAAPVSAQPAPEHAARQPKAAPAQGGSKRDTAPALDRAIAPTPTAAPRVNGKVAAALNAAKDAVAFTPTDAPEAPATQQTPSSAVTGSATSSTHAQHAMAEQVAGRAAPAAHQVAREIVRRFDSGNTRFELRLDPPELGRVEVRLDVSRDHRVTAVIAADSPQALTELARHARDLEQMLQGAGLELSDNGLSFDLRQGGERGETAEFSGPIGESLAQAEEAAPVAARPLGYERWRGVRVDMMV